MLKLTQLPDDLLTSYVLGGRVRNANGSVPSDSQVLTVKKAGGGETFRMSQSSVADLVELDKAMVADGGSRIRLTDVWRDQQFQANARAKYDNWLAAGRPAPGTGAYNSKTMKADYVARSGYSFHGSGLAIDIDVGALQGPGMKLGSNESLAWFWGLAIPHGFRPIIAEPLVSQSEAWHFDHMGPLLAVRDAYRANGVGAAYGETAFTACALASTLPVQYGKSNERYIQALLNLAGFYCGKVDGILGSMTRKALKAAGINSVPGAVTTAAIIGELTAKGVGAQELAAL